MDAALVLVKRLGSRAIFAWPRESFLTHQHDLSADGSPREQLMCAARAA
jgi:hypothetical protein